MKWVGWGEGMVVGGERERERTGTRVLGFLENLIRRLGRRCMSLIEEKKPYGGGGRFGALTGISEYRSK